MSKLRDEVETEMTADLDRYPRTITRAWVRFGFQREVDRVFVWYAFCGLRSIYRGRWSRKYPEVAPKLDAARAALKDLSDAMWGAGR